MLVKTESPNYITLPHMQRLHAIEELKAANIPYEVFTHETAPDEAPLSCEFKGRTFKTIEVSVIKAPVTPESLIKTLEEKSLLEYKNEENS